MSEYQYYEFLAVDRPLDADARAALRTISSRAQITATSFSNEYNYGDLKANPLTLLGRYFDLMFYTGFWSVRQFAMRVPARLIDRAAIEAFNIDGEFLRIKQSGDTLIIDVPLSDLSLDEGDDEPHWMSALTPLRAAVMSGDLRFFYLLWLMQVGFGDVIPDDVPEPLPGIAPLDGALSAWADFLQIDPNLLRAAAERGGPAVEPDDAAVDAFLQSLDAAEKLAILQGIYQGNGAHIAADLRRRCRASVGASAADEPRRSAGELRAAVQRVAAAQAEKQRLRDEAEQRRKAELDARIKAARLARLSGREAQAWIKVEELIEQRNRKGYDEAVTLIQDLRELVSTDEFASRVERMRVRHGTKRVFIAQLDAVSGIRPRLV